MTPKILAFISRPGPPTGAPYVVFLGLQVVDTLAVGGHYACGMDINQTTRTLVMCGVTKVRTRASRRPAFFALS